MLALAYEHQDAGRPIFICTAAAQEMAELLAIVLTFDGAVGSVAEVIDGVYTGREGGPFNYREGKAQAIRELAAREDIDLWEINEAFASVTLNSVRMLGIDEDRVNVNGGAVAIGHPIGASGARILATLVHELRRRGGGYGCAAICSGGGQGDAVIVQV
jgi:hypothetical protein